jgi:serine/threonine-protein kinase
VQPGDFIDRYRIERLLGEGGMAQVWLGTHAILASRHAIKVLRPELAAVESLRDRFLAEGRIAAQIRHPNIVDVTDVVVAPGVAGLVMEYVEGATLEDVLEARGAPLTAAECVTLLLPVLDGVDEAHAFGVVHRDLKPANVLVARDRRGRLRPVVLDFGIAKLAEHTRVVHTTRMPTQDGTRMGTPAFMSPEQVRATARVDHRTDVFALGAILYQCATGLLPFSGESDFETMQAIVAGRYTPPEQAHPDVHPRLADVIRTALALRPEDRFADCGAFSAALAEVHSPTRAPTPAPPPTRPPPAPAAPRPEAPTARPAAPPPSAEPPWRGPVLVADDGRRHPLRGAEHTVGRSPECDVVVDDPSASPVHCVVARSGRTWSVEDRRSALGTLVDGALIVGRSLLAPGQVITVGSTRLRLEER